MKQQARTNTFFEFCNATTGTLIWYQPPHLFPIPASHTKRHKAQMLLLVVSIYQWWTGSSNSTRRTILKSTYIGWDELVRGWTRQ